jgi:hypothetical protein
MIRQKTIIDDLGKLTSRLVHTNYKQSKPPGRSLFRPEPQQLTNRKFMSKPQRSAFDQGEEIWV